MGLGTWLFSRTKLYKELMRSVGTQVYQELLRYVQNRPAYPPDNIETYINDGYLFNPYVYSIVSFIAQKAGAIPWGVYEVKNDKALHLYKSTTKPDLNSRIVRTKALIAIENHELSELFIKPNVLQGWAEFFEQVAGFKLITGDSYVHCVGPSGGLNAGKVKELWSIPSQIIKPVAGDRTEPIKGYQYMQIPELLPTEQIIHLKYWTPEYLNGTFLYGISPIRAGKRVVTRSNASYDASVSSFQNMGAFGIISANGKSEVDFTEEQADMIEKRFARKTGPKNWGKPLITAADIRWQQIGMSPVDLNIIENDKMDLRTLCSIYHVPSELFNDSANKTYSNTKEAGSAVYTNAVLPLLNQFRDAFNMFIKGKYPENIYIDYDASMISELQDDLVMITAAIGNAWWINPNERRDIMNFPADEVNPLMNEYWVPLGLNPMGADRLDDQALEEVEKRLKINDYSA